jgi:hypothetical protein
MSIVSTYPNKTYIVADVYTATSWAMAAGVITWSDPLATNGQVITRYNAITKASITPSVAQTLQVVLVTPTATANSVYTLMIQQYNFSTGRTYTGTYTYTTAASGDTATTISNAFKNQINADPNIKISTDAVGAATATLTAEAGFPVFTVTVLSAGGGLTAATTTPGVVAVGTTAALALQGITVSGAAYTTVHLEYSPVTGQNIKDGVAVASVLDLYLNAAEGDLAAVVAAITADLDGTDVADAVAVI